MKNTEKNIKRDVNWVMGRKNPRHGLLPVRTVLAKAGNPQDAVRTVHIAGTNGKGSTTNYLCDILMADGYTVGTYTSPHLEEHYDRIRINGKWIPADTYQMYLDRYMDDIDTYDLGMFEIAAVIAFTWFRDMKVDIALIETGLGGRLDTTNVIRNPELCVITTIGMDHMEILGSRLSQIAYEKAGIIMEYGHCAAGMISGQARAVIQAQAKRKHGAVSFLQYRSTGEHSFICHGHPFEIQGAVYQKDNAALALHSAWMLGVDISSEAVRKAVYDSAWAGRFETICRDPLIIIDGAHNEEGARALAESMKNLKEPVVCVFSCLADKEGKKMVSVLENVCSILILTHFDNARSASAVENLSDAAIRINDWQEAIEEGLRRSGTGSLVITGSLYFISMVREWGKKHCG